MFPGWNVETSHPVDGQEPCGVCLGLIQPAIDMAEDWGFVAMGSEVQDEEGNTHTVVVRRIAEEPEPEEG